MKRKTYRELVLAEYRIARDEGHRAQLALQLAKYMAKYRKGSMKLKVLPSRFGVYESEEITELPNGWKLKVEFQRDESSGPPEKECDGHGIVTKWRSYTDNPDYWEVCYSGYIYRYYDWKASLKIALKDEWDSSPFGQGTKQEQAMRAIKGDYDYLRRWYNDEWFYVGMIVTLLDENDEELDQDSCWGYESFGIEDLGEQARSWAASMIRKARNEHRYAVENRFRDAMACGV